MTERLLSSGDLMEVTGVDHNDLNLWCRRGLLTPVEGGGGLGSHRRFTVLQAVAVAYVVRYKEHIGAHYRWAEKAMRGLLAMREDRLRAAVAAGRSIGWSTPKGKFLLVEAPEGFPFKDAPWMDMAGVIRQVDEGIEAVGRRLAGRGPRTGRRRGLADVAVTN